MRSESFEEDRAFVWRVAYRFLRSREDAQDVAQEVLLALHQRAPAIPAGGTLKSWLYRVTANAALNLSRRRRRQERVARTVAEETPRTHEMTQLTGLAGAIDTGIRALPPQQRAVVTLRLLEECTFREIAESFGVSQGTVKVQFARGMRKLRENLAEWR